MGSVGCCGIDDSSSSSLLHSQILVRKKDTKTQRQTPQLIKHFWMPPVNLMVLADEFTP